MFCRGHRCLHDVPFEGIDRRAVVIDGRRAFQDAQTIVDAGEQLLRSFGIVSVFPAHPGQETGIFGRDMPEAEID